VADKNPPSARKIPSSQTTLDCTATLVPGKPLILGTLNIPGTNAISKSK
jgi:hypothetical protein